MILKKLILGITLCAIIPSVAIAQKAKPKKNAEAHKAVVGKSDSATTKAITIPAAPAKKLYYFSFNEDQAQAIYQIISNSDYSYRAVSQIKSIFEYQIMHQPVADTVVAKADTSSHN